MRVGGMVGAELGTTVGVAVVGRVGTWVSGARVVGVEEGTEVGETVVGSVGA